MTTGDVTDPSVGPHEQTDSVVASAQAVPATHAQPSQWLRQAFAGSPARVNRSHWLGCVALCLLQGPVAAAPDRG